MNRVADAGGEKKNGRNVVPKCQGLFCFFCLAPTTTASLSIEEEAEIAISRLLDSLACCYVITVSIGLFTSMCKPQLQPFCALNLFTWPAHKRLVVVLE